MHMISFLKNKICLILAVLLSATPCLSARSVVDSMSQQEIHDMVKSLVESANSNSPVALDDGTILSTGLIMDLDDKNRVLSMHYLVPGYSLDNSPEAQEFSKLNLAGAVTQKPASTLEMLCQVYEALGYNLKISYSDGNEPGCTINLTPQQLTNLWTKPLTQSGIDPQLCRQGYLKSAEAGVVGLELLTGLKFNVALALEDNWMAINFDAVEPLELAEPLTKEDIIDMLGETTFKIAAGIMDYASEFIGVDGYKITFDLKNNKRPMVYNITWKELM